MKKWSVSETKGKKKEKNYGRAVQINYTNVMKVL